MNRSPLLQRRGKLARESGFNLPIQVLESARGFYIGTFDDTGPVSRESLEYYDTRSQAEYALSKNTWTQFEEF